MSTDLERSAPARWDERYRRGATGWDHGVVAPEVAAFAAEHPGHGAWALDIGCGTGTHGRELARNGYRVLGLDLSRVALQRAAAAAQVEGVRWAGIQGSAPELDLLAVSLKMALDVGCLHTLGEAQLRRYAAALNRRMAAGGHYLLYAVHERQHEGQGGPPGLPPALIESAFSPYFELVRRDPGWQGVRRSDWWVWRKP